MQCVGHVEIEPYAQKVLLKHWPDVPLLEDVKNVKGDEFGQVDVLCGGFPCQDLSVAGKQEGITGQRSGLFDEAIRICGVCRPKFFVLENVANLLSRPDWFGYVLGRIAEIGYDAEWEVIPASAAGADHKRERVFIVAYPDSTNMEGVDVQESIFPYPEESFRRKFAGAIDETIPADDYARMRGNIDGVPQIMDRLKCLGNAIVPQIAEYIGRQIMEVK